LEFRVEASRPDRHTLLRAAAIVRDGGIVAYPTDTLYGLAANPASAAAMAQLYRIKGRPVDLAIPLIASGTGQIEAAKAAGMNRILLFRRILLPQMWRFALPGLGNVWMVLIKATALVSVIQLPELMRNADIASRATRLPFTCYFAASLIYLLMTVVSMSIQQRAETWANRGIRKA